MSNLFLSLVIRARNMAHGALLQATHDVDHLANRTRLAQDVGRGLGRAISWGAGAVVGSLTAMTVAVIKTTAKFEQYETVLTTLEGTQAKAKASMAWVTKFAATTPFSVDQVMEAFVRLKAYGIDPTDGSLRTLGDTASAMGKPLMAAVEAMADAQTGEFERLKEFGIKARVQGQQVLFTYTRDGKEMVVKAKKNATDINRALRSIWGDSFNGAMEAQSRTFNGLLSNLGDTWTQLLLKIGNSGLFDKAKSILQGWMTKISAAASDGSLDRWALKTSTALGGLLTTVAGIVESIDWPRTVSGIGKVIESLGGFVKAIGGLQGLLDLGVAAMITQLTITLAGLGTVLEVTGGALMLTPWGWFVGAVAAVAAIAYVVIRNWGPISAFFKRLWGGIVSFTAPAFNFLKNLFLNFTPTGWVIKNWGPISAYLKGLWRNIGIIVGLAFKAAKTLFFEFHPLGIIIKNWGPITRFLASLWNGIKAFTSAAFRFLRAVIMEYTPIGDIVRNWGAIKGWLKNLWDGVKSNVSGGIDAAKDAIGKYLPMEAINKNWEPVRAFFTKLWNDIKGYFTDGIKNISAQLSQWSPGGLLRGAGVFDFVTGSERRTAAATRPAGAITPRGAPAAPSARGVVPAKPAHGRLDAVIDFRNLPPGVRTSVRTQGAGVTATTRSRPAYRGATTGSR